MTTETTRNSIASSAESELPDYLGSNLSQPPRYTRVRRPQIPLSYSFTPGDDLNTMMMMPPEESDDRGQYRVSVSLNLNPFVPLSYRTSVHRVEEAHESFIGDFELSPNQRRAILTIGDTTARLSDVMYATASRHWLWNWEGVGLRWDCRVTLEDGSPMCICYTRAESPAQLATFVPPPLDAPPPLPHAVLTIFPDGHHSFDHILLSALIVQRKLALDY
ncbi:unnamed protein product [Mycena citricolor]|uniref:Uncharacterized protein n=1 Tax=Mycena citricolor TaxID=2018698 RepID=A0AAD2HG64_9AGAR|nr:unnamed protein product [Mycena citricolor]